MKKTSKTQLYQETLSNIQHLIDGEDDEIAIMATIVCELHHAFDTFDWTGFYRVVKPGLLKIGPYQGSHGCLRIPFDKGVCGAAARSRKTQVVPDVHQFPGHIACSSSTVSEIVVPVFCRGELVAVLDIDSNQPAAFGGTDQMFLEELCAMIGTALQ